MPVIEHPVIEKTVQSARLIRLRKVAGTALAGLTAVFIGTHFADDPNDWILFARSVAEAGMIGGLADWFAVEAIFRQPLRLPIPHTALLRARKDQAADNIGKFIEDYILVPEQIGESIQTLEPVKLAALWLNEKNNADHVAHLLVGGLQNAFGPGRQSAIRREFQHLIAALLDQGRDSPAISALVAEILKKGAMGNGFSQMLGQISDLLDHHRDAILTIVQDNSRWWVASSVDRKVAVLIVDAVISFLDELGKPESELHRQFESVFFDFVADMEETGTLNALLSGEGDSQNLAIRLTDAGFEMLDAVFQKSETSNAFSDKMSLAIRNAAQHLLEDHAAREALDGRLKNLVETVTVQNRKTIGRYVAKTIRAWDADILVERFEAELGPDLQYIRLNGTVLGAVIGGVIFAFEFLLA